MAVHRYAVSGREPASILELTHRIMRRSGDHKRVWITELDWATGGPRFPFIVFDRRQVKLLRQSLTRFTSCRKRWG